MTTDQSSTARLDMPLPQVAADAWNLAHPVGTPVAAYPGVLPADDTPHWPCERLATRTRSRAQVLGGHTAVVWVEGHGACIALTHIDPSPGAVAAAWKACTPPEALADGLREQRHALYDLDPDSVVRLPDSIPMCLPRGTQPPGGSRG